MKQHRQLIFSLCNMLGLLLLSCSAEEDAGGGSSEVYLRPQFYTGPVVTRSVVNGTAAASGDGNINTVTLFVTKTDGHTPYPGIENSGKTDFTATGSGGTLTWSGNVKLHNETARIFAYANSPVDPAPSFTAAADENHYINVTIPDAITFNGANSWECNTTDYLYGSSSNTEAKPITANNAEGQYKPSIYLHHALALVVFQMQTYSGRPVTDYDYVKNITLDITGSTTFRKADSNAGKMYIKDGSLSDLTGSNRLTFAPQNGTNAVQCGNSKAATVAYGLVAPLTTAPQANDVSITVRLDKQSETTVNYRTLKQTLPSRQWKAGYKYVYKLILSDRAVSIANITETPIKGWEDINGSGELKPDGI